MTTPYISQESIIGDPEAVDKTQKNLIIKLKPHIIFKPKMPDFQARAIFTDENKVKYILTQGKTRKWQKIVEKELYSVTQSEGRRPATKKMELQGINLKTVSNFF